MISILKTLWLVFLHAFQPRVTKQYPEEKAYLAPRYRGRIILSRDPDGEERCVACYLCAVVCPVDCIALQATEDEPWSPLSGILPDQLLTLHLLRLLRRSLPDLRDPIDPGCRNVRIPSPEPGVRERASVD